MLTLQNMEIVRSWESMLVRLEEKLKKTRAELEHIFAELQRY